MLVKFQDDMGLRGSIPYDDIGTIREDNDGFGILKTKSGEVILTSMSYPALEIAYQTAIEEDLESLLDIDPDD